MAAGEIGERPALSLPGGDQMTSPTGPYSTTQIALAIKWPDVECPWRRILAAELSGSTSHPLARYFMPRKKSSGVFTSMPDSMGRKYQVHYHLADQADSHIFDESKTHACFHLPDDTSHSSPNIPK